MHRGQTDQKVKIIFYYFLIYFTIRSTDLLFVSECMLHGLLATVALRVVKNYIIEIASIMKIKLNKINEIKYARHRNELNETLE